MAFMKRMAVLAAAAGAARAYAKKNPEKVNDMVGKAGRFVDEKTKGTYHSHIDGATKKVADVTKPKPKPNPAS
ncbi:antitoxin [Amycolatopsis sp. FDAARGOS 1241]|uniref:antitoxin n=1 Tax=Amycolatopsis sp. FDAARGOS 1241 TaxID=2778070 RepID=UPI001951501C|nr:antitoxin [Amycolatopsis sp. FDAARGOS 1241]QRP48804.1 antitoxin [Amycolatopsis sp. FDAARGOS 1241]